MISRKIEVHLDLPDSVELRERPGEEVAAGMDEELGRFGEWFQSKGNAPLVGVERSILKTFLAWKLLYEEGDVDSQD